MAKDNSFDIVSEPDISEVLNAIDQTRREALTRYDFRGHEVSVQWDAEQRTIQLDAPAGMVLDALLRVLQEKMAKRGVSLRFLEVSDPVPHGMDRARQTVTLKKGIDTVQAKAIQKMVRGLGLKVDVQIQGESVRVSGKSKDDLQAVIREVKAHDFGIELSFTNFR